MSRASAPHRRAAKTREQRLHPSCPHPRITKTSFTGGPLRGFCSVLPLILVSKCSGCRWSGPRVRRNRSLGPGRRVPRVEPKPALMPVERRKASAVGRLHDVAINHSSEPANTTVPAFAGDRRALGRREVDAGVGALPHPDTRGRRDATFGAPDGPEARRLARPARSPWSPTTDQVADVAVVNRRCRGPRLARRGIRA